MAGEVAEAIVLGLGGGGRGLVVESFQWNNSELDGFGMGEDRDCVRTAAAQLGHRVGHVMTVRTVIRLDGYHDM